MKRLLSLAALLICGQTIFAQQLEKWYPVYASLNYRDLCFIDKTGNVKLLPCENEESNIDCVQ